MRFNRRYVLLAILILAIIVLFLPIKTDYSFDSTAKILPVKEWRLKRGQDDSYISELRNNKTDVLSLVKGYKFERGDISEIVLLKDMVSGSYSEPGDTLAYINSYFIENEITKLHNLKKIEQENMVVKLSGEKQPLIDEAVQRYNFARQQKELEEKNFNRYKKLYSDSIISTAEFEIYENAFKLAEINLEIANSEMISLKSGAKNEEIEYTRQKIEAFQREIETLERLKNEYFVTCPIGGVVSFNSTIEDIISINDTSQYVLMIPVKVNNVQYLDRISGIKFSIPGYDEMMSASFISLDEKVNLFANQQLVMAKAIIDGGQFKLYPGMAVQCTVVCDKISIFNFLTRSIQFQF